jgi:rubrerythrin
MAKIPDALKISLDFERRGVDFYLNTAKKTKNPLARRLFHSLAIEEIQHIMKFEDIYENLKEQKKWPRWTVAEGKKLEVIIKDFFAAARKDKTICLADNIKGLELAMEMEKKGYRMYEEFLEKAADENEKIFYRELLKQESKHYEALANVHSYLTNTGDWLEEEESKTWNWMNL